MAGRRTSREHAGRRAARPSSAVEVPADRIDAVRRFNRFYTARIGVLTTSLLGSEFTLAEVRVLYEIAHRDQPTASELVRDLRLDQGYVSRIVRKFEMLRFVSRTQSETDGRKSHLDLTAEGRAALVPLDRAALEQVAEILAPLPEEEQARLVASLASVQRLLGDGAPSGASEVVVRAHRPGDLGWIVHRHGALYAREHGWDERFEGLVARIAADFLEGHDPERERCFVAEAGGAVVGSVLLVAKSRTVAQLRLLLVEPEARGRGVGTRLVAECVRFARGTGYRKIVLWTVAELDAARRVYERAGFRRTAAETVRKYGKRLTSQTWELAL